MSDQFLTAKDISGILKVSKAMAYRLIAHGQIPAIRIGRVTRVRPQDLDAFIQSCAITPEVDGTVDPITDAGLRQKGGDEQNM